MVALLRRRRQEKVTPSLSRDGKGLHIKALACMMTHLARRFRVAAVMGGATSGHQSSGSSPEAQPPRGQPTTASKTVCLLAFPRLGGLKARLSGRLLARWPRGGLCEMAGSHARLPVLGHWEQDRVRPHTITYTLGRQTERGYGKERKGVLGFYCALRAGGMNDQPSQVTTPEVGRRNAR